MRGCGESLRNLLHLEATLRKRFFDPVCSSHSCCPFSENYSLSLSFFLFLSLSHPQQHSWRWCPDNRYSLTTAERGHHDDNPPGQAPGRGVVIVGTVCCICERCRRFRIIRASTTGTVRPGETCVCVRYSPAGCLVCL